MSFLSSVSGFLSSAYDFVTDDRQGMTPPSTSAPTPDNVVPATVVAQSPVIDLRHLDAEANLNQIENGGASSSRRPTSIEGRVGDTVRVVAPNLREEGARSEVIEGRIQARGDLELAAQGYFPLETVHLRATTNANDQEGVVWVKSADSSRIRANGFDVTRANFESNGDAVNLGSFRRNSELEV